MREIKFRAWDVIDEQFYSEKTGFSPASVLLHADEHDCPLMQYTGLKVKGKEVYEDDILESDTRWYQVMWCDHYGAWLASGLFGNEDMMLSEICGDRDTCLEGNIYENPELIKN